MKVQVVTLLGHKDHGKSTLIGSMMIRTGAVTKERIREAQKISSNLGRQFEPGYILDSFAEEREGEMTIDTTRGNLVWKRKAFELIDVPGHEELIKNMISGASYANIALLVVSAKEEEGIEPMTKRHLFIARMLGIDKVVVAVNKIDLNGYDKARFNNIKIELSTFIKRIGFDVGSFEFVPISAYNGDNLTARSKKTWWYTGSPLMDVIYRMSREGDARRGGALRLMVQGTVDGKGRLVAGRVLSGTVRRGSSVVMVPGGKGSAYRVREILSNGRAVASAGTGASVALRLAGAPNGELRGRVISEAKNPPKAERRIRALVFVTDKLGGRLNVGINGLNVRCKSMKILGNIDTTTGKAYSSRKADALNAVEASLQLDQRVAIESYARLKEMGRFVLYSQDKFAGIGIVE